VARGDLGAELPIEDVPLLQVRLHCIVLGRPNLSCIADLLYLVLNIVCEWNQVAR
jgi:hypothetical protein